MPADKRDCDSDSDCSTSAGSVSEADATLGWNWQDCHPSHGMEKYVSALQLLGLDLARSVPQKVKQEAIVGLGDQPTSDLIIGHFSKRGKTRERVLFLSSDYILAECCMAMCNLVCL